MLMNAAASSHQQWFVRCSWGPSRYLSGLFLWLRHILKLHPKTVGRREQLRREWNDDPGSESCIFRTISRFRNHDFIAHQNGTLFQRDPGTSTDEIASAMMVGKLLNRMALRR
jgi:hypothetical protein